ncbi:P-loop containing nucleoside triphosphate hydrolase protein [Lindgomyces ingoldianus]|uniref:P-loop containing nucleoside triphosphate hydrolase protein n=1 Tax=Lindgomyces ingoldianus TaxID=673940 RepID=A0ACB6QYT3_9PLEO|nr:P-loop containing nucleoside triphosphate hydrolase protein [Lindgomyces ingoldianus]KAF2471432.1 P-loop containing nucleoside triphosphate hydrolase protein [Lindgomyces ingoldianus]
MNLLLRQIWALIRKNLLLICARRPISTFIRAIAIPLVVVLVVAYSKNFFSSNQTWGFSGQHNIRSLKDGLEASSGHNVVGFVDNGMTGGAVSSVIDSLSRTVRDSGRIARVYKNTKDMSKDCASNVKGVSPCYGAVVFLSSPDEGSASSDKGVWNYTILGDDRASGSKFVNVKNDKNGPEVYLLPFQRAVDMEIISRSTSNNASALPSTSDLVYTYWDQSDLDQQRESNYLALCIYIFGAIFSLAMLGVVYHMTSFVASERERGLSGLIDTMIPGGSKFRARFLRIVSTYCSFAVVYFPSWLAVGIVISKVVFPKTSHNIPVGYHILSGLAFCSFSLFGSSFFKKAPLSGSIMIVIIFVFAILPQVLQKQTTAQVVIFSLLFPSANYTYFITGLALWESVELKADIMQHTEDDDAWRIKLYLHLVFLCVQIIVYPILAFFLEHFLFGTASPGRGFSKPSASDAPTVTLSGFCKTYKPNLLKTIFKAAKPVPAVVNMDLKAFKGQILCLLGPNGSGKSSTLNSLAGQLKVTSGKITIDPTGGLGFAPQNNVLWDDLTVEEHIRIFSDLKCIAPVNEEVVAELVKACDLENKLPFRAKTLSGGQKRKLQLAAMFAGGSSVCLVDEVSTGLDPISRRRIWEILLAERARRTIIMTTHFLDEADYLADNIAIMFKGSLKVEGTSATLKSTFGNGFTVKLPENVDIDIPLSGPVEKEASRHQMVYRVSTAAIAAELIEHLDRNKIRNYQVSGPTMEELFLKVTGDKISDESSSMSGERDDTETRGALMATDTSSGYALREGRPISVFLQWWLLFCKRFRILKRRYIPYFFTIVIAIVGAGVAPLLIKSFNKPMQCPQPADLVVDYSFRSDLSSFSTYAKLLFGPANALNDEKLAQIAEVYSTKRTRYPTYYGFNSTEQLRELFTPVDTYDEFSKYFEANHTRYSTWGGIWVGDKPTIAFNVWEANSGVKFNNLINNYLSNVPISAGYGEFPFTQLPSVYDIKPLMFMLYYGLIMAIYPAFFALYPTNERISNVRSMQYSNGIRPFPLWLSHLAFDTQVILVVSVVGIALLSASTPVWYGLPLLWVVMFLFGISSTLISYLVSMFAKSPVAAWFVVAMYNIVMYFAYFGALIGTQSKFAFQELENINDKVYFPLALISPIVSLEKAFAVGLGQFGFLCNGHSGGSLSLYGGPILYLLIQAILCFALLLWWDSFFPRPSFLRRSRKPVGDSETSMHSADLMEELQRLQSKSTDLKVETVTKCFGRNLAVDNVTFGVQTGEIFALLGPNGAGKSTVISMIRGDIKPSTRESNLVVAGHSVLTDPISARSSLGVCPQFDSADVLTVTETLRFFAKTRGVKDIAHNVSTVITACGLEPWADQLAQKLSGGTKRKLSLAVALVGNPRVLVLDEPSSALDANAKRNMWRILQGVSKGRAVVLTTHSMEEADAISDRIAIISSRMLAIGEREALKRRAGNNFHLHLVSRSAPRTSNQELQVMKDWIQYTFPTATISRETQGGQLRFEIPAEGHNLVGLIRTLEACKGDLGVEFYSVGKATLDEVFENIVRRYGDERAGEK